MIMFSRRVLTVLGAIGVVAVIALLALSLPGRTTVRIAGQDIPLLLADNPVTRTRGLSGRSLDGLHGTAGMLFVFPEPAVQHFWMKKMEFPLDVLWIHRGVVVAIEQNVPAPTAGAQPRRMTSDPLLVDMVIELPAGGVNLFGIVLGTPITVGE